MSNRIVCPFISKGNEIMQCHPMCKCLDSNNECKMIKFMDNIDKLANKTT